MKKGIIYLVIAFFTFFGLEVYKGDLKKFAVIEFEGSKYKGTVYQETFGLIPHDPPLEYRDVKTGVLIQGKQEKGVFFVKNDSGKYIQATSLQDSIMSRLMRSAKND